MPKDTTSSFPGFCAIRADQPTNQRGGGLLTLIRDDLVFQKTGKEYSPPLERLTVQVQLSLRKWATIHNIYAAPIRSKLSDKRGEQLEDWVIAHSASVLNDETATLLNRATGDLSSHDVSLAHPSLADKAEWTVGENLGSDHLPITIELRCQTPVASDFHKRARWNTRDVNWQAFLEAVEESVRSF